MISDLIGAYGAWMAAGLLGSLSMVAGWAMFTRLAGDGI